MGNYGPFINQSESAKTEKQLSFIKKLNLLPEQEKQTYAKQDT